MENVEEIKLFPGNLGRDCPGNGTRKDTECCCDECDYMLCCLDSHDDLACKDCKDKTCPRASL